MKAQEALARGPAATAPYLRDDGAGPKEQAVLDTLPSSPRLRRLLHDLDDLMAEEGFLHLGTAEIAARLRCSKASLYRLAPGLDELFELAIRLRFARVTDAVQRAYGASGEWTGKLVAWVDAFVTEQSKVSYAFMKDLFAFPPGADLVKAARALGVRELREIMEGGIAAGEFQPVDPGLAAHLLSMTVNSICEPEFQSSTGLPIAEGLAEALRVFELGIIRRADSR